MRRSKVLRTLFFLLLLSLCAVFTAYGSGNTIREIKISVELNQDGSAQITEIWDVNVGSGTEWYLVQGNLGKIKIEDFSVSDEKGLVYENIGSWNVNRSLEEKAGKCGTVYRGDGNYELCFGVGSYGNHVFTVTYRMTNFVKGFKDYCGFNQRFVNDELSSNPQYVSVMIEKPGETFISEEVKVWAFGFDGSIYVKDGAVIAESSGPLSSSDYVNIMCRFPREMFNTSNLVNGSFEAMRERAFEGSDYKEESGSSGIMLFAVKLWISLMVLLLIGIVLFALAEHIRAKTNVPTTFEESRALFMKQKDSRMAKKPLYLLGCLILFIINPVIGIVFGFIWGLRKQVKGDALEENATGAAYSLSNIKSFAAKNPTYYRDIPMNGNICKIHAALKLTGINPSDSDIIGAYLLRWLQHKAIAIENTKKTGLGGLMGQETPSIVLRTPPAFGDSFERKLYDLLLKASGGDRILQEKELYKWSKTHYGEMKSWLDQAERNGERYLRQDGYMSDFYVPSYFNMSLKRETAFTEAGRQAIFRLYGFQNYLKDFTLMQEREPLSVELWDDYLVVAQLFGMADRVAETFSRLYPSRFEQKTHSYGENQYDMAFTFTIVHAISHAGVYGAQRGADAARSSSSSYSGGGGSSSSGGGGGYSGGGSGGGSR